MMRRAGKPSEHMARLISKSYCSAYCLEGQIFDRPGPGATRPRSGLPARNNKEVGTMTIDPGVPSAAASLSSLDGSR
jgi:hypothetical protein